MNTDWLAQPCAVLNEASRTAALARQEQLTKPPGSLGKLEAIAVQLSALQGTEKPKMERVHISIFAADHGVAAEGVSAFPQAVTAEMVKNFARGGAAISVLAQQVNATLEVVNLGTVFPVEPLAKVRDEHIAAGTANFAQGPAMTEEQLAQALQAGQAAALRAKQDGAQLFIGGEMGIANTTSASAIACALLQESPQLLAGPGTGLDGKGVERKAAVIQRALDLHQANLAQPLDVLRRLGGFEIAALAGAYLAAAQNGLPVLVDGFISSVAALAAVRIQPDVRDWLLFAHASAEPGHRRVLAALAAEPLLQLGMRLGEGSGAATAVPLLQLACALHNNMATFAEAGVSDKL
ncbi:MAG: nicotinate-nucleotide--dimethylbenzimidazole phosphoribosyltransferase [Nitrosomonadales bacterium]|nr:nicotinate-nucleotide--dimethylbenzimidazole phosphoribosyltransferase [Nitrosomonadales bacterium]